MSARRNSRRWVGCAYPNAGDSRGIRDSVPGLPPGRHQPLAAVRKKAGNGGSHLASHHVHCPIVSGAASNRPLNGS